MDDAKVLSRRRFLAGSAAVGAAAVAGGVAGGLGAIAVGATSPSAVNATGTEPGYIPFDRSHQSGVVLPTRPQTAAICVALDAVVGSKRADTTWSGPASAWIRPRIACTTSGCSARNAVEF